METYQLVPHPAYPPAGLRAVEAKIIGADASWLRVRWRLDGAEQLHVPPFAGKGRGDELWRTTCFEMFLRPEGGEAYCELNLSPSERWNAYDFNFYRGGMSERPFPREPQCSIRQGTGMAIFDAAIPLAGLPTLDCALGLCAVIEEQGGTLSYWALAHSGEQPDFHDPACFTARLAAPAGA